MEVIVTDYWGVFFFWNSVFCCQLVLSVVSFDFIACHERGKSVEIGGMLLGGSTLTSTITTPYLLIPFFFNLFFVGRDCAFFRPNKDVFAFQRSLNDLPLKSV
jgi:hypothetical protein